MKRLAIIAAVALMSVPAFAAETEKTTEGIALEKVKEDEQAQSLHGNIETEITDGVMTIRIKATDHDDPKLHWSAYRGDKGTASLTEVLNETDMEEGLAYAGSFRAVPDAGDGEDCIRLVFTNGRYVAEYMDWNVVVKGGKIEEVKGGGQAFPSTAADLAQSLAGVWQEKDGSTSMEISLDKDGTLLCTISNGGGRDGKTSFYTMHPYYDVIKEAMVYWDGEAHSAEITDGAEAAATEAAGEEGVTEAEAPQEGKGTGAFTFEITDGESAAIIWQDDTFGNGDAVRFLKAEN